MCVEIEIDRERIETCGQLWKIIGRENMVFTHDADFKEDDCLCHLDVGATAKRAGYVSRSGWDEAAIDHIWKRSFHTGEAKCRS